MVEEENIDTSVTNGTDDDNDKKVKKSNRHDGGVADLERVTDYAEEKELSSTDITNVNITSSIIIYALIELYSPQAINIFGQKRNQETANKLAKERELQKIIVNKEDIELIVIVLCI